MLKTTWTAPGQGDAPVRPAPVRPACECPGCYLPAHGADFYVTRDGEKRIAVCSRCTVDRDREPEYVGGEDPGVRP